MAFAARSDSISQDSKQSLSARIAIYSVPRFMCAKLLAAPRLFRPRLNPAFTTATSLRRSSCRRQLTSMAAAESGPGSLEEHRKRSWDFFRRIGSPQLHVAPMVDQVSTASCSEGSAVSSWYVHALHSHVQNA